MSSFPEITEDLYICDMNCVLIIVDMFSVEAYE